MSASREPADVLDSGGREPRPGRRAALAVLAVVLLGVAAAGWYADHRGQQGEFAALRVCSERAEAAAAEAVARVDTTAAYVRPSLAFTQGSSAQGLYDMVARTAAGAGRGVASARDACADVDVAGRHDELRAARAARLTHLDATLDLLSRTAADGRVWFSEPADLPRLRQAARTALAAATPTLP